jgi:hypothetical protein
MFVGDYNGTLEAAASSNGEVLRGAPGNALLAFGQQ